MSFKYLLNYKFVSSDHFCISTHLLTTAVKQLFCLSKPCSSELEVWSLEKTSCPMPVLHTRHYSTAGCRCNNSAQPKVTAGCEWDKEGWPQRNHPATVTGDEHAPLPEHAGARAPDPAGTRAKHSPLHSQRTQNDIQLRKRAGRV